MLTSIAAVSGDLPASSSSTVISAPARFVFTITLPTRDFSVLIAVVTSAKCDVLLEGAQRLGVVLQLVVGLAEVVEHRGIRRDLVGFLELDEGRAVIGLAVHRDAAIEVIGGLLCWRVRRIGVRARRDDRAERDK